MTETLPAARPQRAWLRENRLKVALGIAGAEAVIAVFTSGLSRWSILLLAVIAVALWYWAGREARSQTLRDVTWIAAVSQSLALLAVILSSMIGFFALTLAAIFGVIALFLIITDRR